MPSFNLLIEPWIPCLEKNGMTKEMGIKELLLNAPELQEIYDNSPLVTISLYRLLLALLYRALKISTKDDWIKLWQTGNFPPDKLNDYFNQWQDRFDLFDEKYPFYQTAQLIMDKKDVFTRLITELSSGNNTTLFDHSMDTAPREYTPAQAASLLVTAQSFAVGFGKSGEAMLGTIKIKPPYSADALLLRGMTIWLSGKNLFETLLLNLVPISLNESDKPIWEVNSPADLRDQDEDKNDKKIRIRIPEKGILDRFTWQSRLIRLLPEEKGNEIKVKHIYFTQGRSVDKSESDKDPMKIYYRDKKEGYIPISLRKEKAAWRDLQCLFSLGTDNKVKKPEAINFISSLSLDGVIPFNYLCTINMIGLATEEKKAAKLLLWRHDRMPISAELTGNDDLMGRIWRLMTMAEEMAIKVKERIETVCQYYSSPDISPGNSNEINKLSSSIDSTPNYWANLEEPFYHLLKDIVMDKDKASSAWEERLIKEAEASFQTACRSLGDSARAIRAIARVSNKFHIE